jgi:hypothetical protein
MTKDKLLLLGIILIFNLSCSNDDEGVNEIETTDNFYIENYYGFYAQYDVLYIPDPNFSNLVKFEYDTNDRIIKRIGDIVNFSFGGGSVHDSLYTELVYYNNKVHMEKKIAPFGGYSAIEGNETTITFDDNNRMIQKITFEEYSNPQIDTTHYTYANDKLISYLKTSNSTNQGSNWEFRNFEESNLYYTNENLDSIVTIYSYKPNFEDYTVLQRKETKIFNSYDNAQNPFRKLKIFNETFNRSLSKNNFTEYRKTSNYYNYPNNDFYLTPTLSETYEDFFQNWSFAYDENGEWIYNDF